MGSRRHYWFRILCAVFALFVFTSDIVADSIYEASGPCPSDCQTSDCDSCPACACPTHSGSAVITDVVTTFEHDLVTRDWLPLTNDELSPGALPAIDHPPQLA